MIELGTAGTECMEQKDKIFTEDNEENEGWISRPSFSSLPSVQIVFFSVLCASVVQIFSLPP